MCGLPRFLLTKLKGRAARRFAFVKQKSQKKK